MTKLEMVKEMIKPKTAGQLYVAIDLAQRNSKENIAAQYEIYKRKELNEND